jgi:hypothetical protein
VTAPSDPAVAQIDSYVLHLRRHVEALADAPCGRDEHERARDRWSHWFAVQRIARAAGNEVLECEVARQNAERESR